MLIYSLSSQDRMCGGSSVMNGGSGGSLSEGKIQLNVSITRK